MNMGAFPSGQWGQTVNLLLFSFGGSNPPAPTKKLWQKCVTAFFVVSLKNDELISPFFQTFFTVLSNT